MNIYQDYEEREEYQELEECEEHEAPWYSTNLKKWKTWRIFY